MLIEILEEFDYCWTKYENIYVKELMNIEKQARRLIVEGIELDNLLLVLESNNKSQFDLSYTENIEYTELASKLSNTISKINSIANYEGHGRDDLAYKIIESSRQVLYKISVCESESLRKQDKNIIQSFDKMRHLFRKYKENIEVVDPQLRNNPDLVEALVDYEKFWEKGNTYFEDKKRCSQLVYFTNVIEGLCEKYGSFKEKLECCDSEIFILIPMIMILKRVDEEDLGLCETFLPSIVDNTSTSYETFKNIKTELHRINVQYL